MKKLLLGLLAIASLSITGCGNQNYSHGNLSFNYVHVQFPGQEAHHYYVEKWKNDDGGIEIYIKDPESPDKDKHNTLILGDGTYMLYSHNHCPLCHYTIN